MKILPFCMWLSHKNIALAKGKTFWGPLGLFVFKDIWCSQGDAQQLPYYKFAYEGCKISSLPWVISTVWPKSWKSSHRRIHLCVWKWVIDMTIKMTPAVSTTETWATTTAHEEEMSDSKLLGLLSLPYLAIMLILCTMAFTSFYRFHRKHREKYNLRTSLGYDEPGKKKYRVTLNRNAIINGVFYGRGRHLPMQNGGAACSDVACEIREMDSEDKWRLFMTDYRSRYREYDLRLQTYGQTLQNPSDYSPSNDISRVPSSSHTSDTLEVQLTRRHCREQIRRPKSEEIHGQFTALTQLQEHWTEAETRLSRMRHHLNVPPLGELHHSSPELHRASVDKIHSSGQYCILMIICRTYQTFLNG